jgi:hypothetical protein
MPQVKTLRLICIKGGAITQLEQDTILKVVAETKDDLQKKEVEADIEVVTLDFSPAEGTQAGTSFEEMYLQPWSCRKQLSFAFRGCQTIAQEVSCFLRSVCTRVAESKADASTDAIKGPSSTTLPVRIRMSSNPMMEAEGYDEQPKQNVV